MTNASSGGDGTPSPPERVKVAVPTAKEDDASRFSGKNPTGSEKSQKPGVAKNTAARKGNAKTIFNGSKDLLSTVPEGSADEEIQDVEMSESVEAETAGKQDDADDDVSLAARHDKSTQSSLSQAAEERGPPCHQPSGQSDMEESSEEEEEEEETSTIVPSDASSHKMQFYQMKLSTFKKKATASLMKVIKIMFTIDTRMAIELFDSTNEDFEDKPIYCFEDLPETTEETAAYFPPVYDKKNKDGTSIVFRFSTEFSHVEWRKLLEKESSVKHLKLYFGVHKLPSTETQIIGFINQKLPETTFINHYEEYLQSQLTADDPAIAVERIFPRTESGFDGAIKTDVLGIRACKSEAETADKMMKKLLPLQVEGEYYVSFKGLDDGAKFKAYQHQNWYTHKVQRILISDFKNIDQKYDIGLADFWSFREFMKLQPTRTTKIPIDVDNGGFVKKGTKILVLEKYMTEAKEIFDEFRELTASKSSEDLDETMWGNDDDTQVNSNVQGYTEQLHAMFESDGFPELNTKESAMNGRNSGTKAASERANSESGATRDYSRSKREKKNSRKFKGRRLVGRRRQNNRSTQADQGGSVSSSETQKSWSDVVSGEQRKDAKAQAWQQQPRRVNDTQSKQDMEELKGMMMTLLTNSEIARNEANAQARQVQLWSRSCRSLASQVSELYKVVETLSQASSCSGSSLSSVTASLEKVRQAQKDCPIPMEVILDHPDGDANTMATLSDTNTQGTGAPEQAKKTTPNANSEQKEITPDKTGVESLDDATIPESPMEGDGESHAPAEGADPALQEMETVKNATDGNGDGFQTPTRRHQVSAAAAAAAETATAMGGVVETANPYEALTTLGSSRSRGSSSAQSPSGSSPRKKKPKVSPKFRKKMEEHFEKQKREEAAATVNDDISVSLLGRFGGAVKAGVASVTGYATQDDTVTGEENAWQNSWDSPISDDKN